MENNVFNGKSNLDEFSEKDLMKLMFTHLVKLGRRLNTVEKVIGKAYPEDYNEIIKTGVSTTEELREMQEEYNAIWYELELYLSKLK